MLEGSPRPSLSKALPTSPPEPRSERCLCERAILWKRGLKGKVIREMRLARCYLVLLSPREINYLNNSRRGMGFFILF